MTEFHPSDGSLIVDEVMSEAMGRAKELFAELKEILSTEGREAGESLDRDAVCYFFWLALSDQLLSGKFSKTELHQDLELCGERL